MLGPLLSRGGYVPRWSFFGGRLVVVLFSGSGGSFRFSPRGLLGCNIFLFLVFYELSSVSDLGRNSRLGFLLRCIVLVVGLLGFCMVLGGVVVVRRHIFGMWAFLDFSAFPSAVGLIFLE